MNKSIKFLVSIILIALVSTTQSEPRAFTADIVCDDLNQVVKILVDNGEQPVMVAQSAVSSPNGLALTVSVWMNQQGEMTVTQSSEYKMCIIAMGTSSKMRLPEARSSTRYY